MRLAVVLACAATSASAQSSALLDFMGGQGCTFGPDSIAAAQAAGFGPDSLNNLQIMAVNEGNAKRQGDYVVLDASICTIRLPDIQSAYDLDDPRIRAIAPYVRDVFEYNGEIDITEGCFLDDPHTLFTKLNNGDADAGFDDYISFVAVNIIGGDIRFHAPTPLATPRGFQIVTGDCARAPDVPAIVENHPFIAEGFDRYVREIGALTSCDELMGSGDMALTASIQGLDPFYEGEVDPSFNAWLFMEYTMIAWAAGWREGMTATDKGALRPPMCHYPD